MTIPNWTAENSLSVGSGFHYQRKSDHHLANGKGITPQYIDPCFQKCSTWECYVNCRARDFDPTIWW